MAKALIINAFALTGRLDYIYPYTQGGAQGYVLLPLRGVLLRLLTHPPMCFWGFQPVLLTFDTPSYVLIGLSARIIEL